MRAILLIGFVLLSNAWVHAQIKVNGAFSNQSIASVLSDWSKEFKTEFAYDSYELSRYTFTGRFENQNIEEALERLLKDSPFTYRSFNQTWVIYPVPQARKAALADSRYAKRIQGRVCDRLTGEVLPFASVGTLHSGTTTSTDTEGKFTLESDGATEVDTLAVVYLGYQSFLLPFNWRLDSLAWKIELIPSNALLPDVEIKSFSARALRMNDNASFYTASPNHSALRLGVGEPDLFRLAQITSGISGSQENSNGLFIRGSSSDQSQLLLDGFNIYHQDHFFGMFSSVNSWAVKTMRVHKFITDPSLGGRAAGTVELIAREGDLRKPSVRIECGTLSASGAVEAPLDSSGRASVFVCGRQSIAEWVKGPAYKELFNTLYSASIVDSNNSNNEQTRDTFNPQLLFQDLNVKFTYRPNDSNRLNVSYYASRDELNFAYADTSSVETINVSDIRYSDEAQKTNQGISMRWHAQPTSRLEVNSSIGFSTFQGMYFGTDSIRNNLFALDSSQYSFRDVTLRDWNALHSYTFKTGSHALKWGGNVNFIGISDKQRFSQVISVFEKSSAITFTGFAGDEWTMKRWIIMPGVRYNLYRRTTLADFWEPRCMVRFYPKGNQFFLKAAASRAVQFVQRVTNQSLYSNVPDQWQLAGSELPVLHTNHLLVGMNYSAGDWNADVELFHKQTENQVLDARAGDFTNRMPTGYLVGSSRATGIDATLQWQHSPHQLVAAYSLLLAFSNYDGLETKYVAESYNRLWEGKIAYEWVKGPWNVSLLMIGAAGAPYTSLLGSVPYSLPDGTMRFFPLYGGYNRARTAPYFRTDLSAGFRWLWNAMRWQLNASVYNVFDTPNYRAVQYSVLEKNTGPLAFNERPIRMLGRIPSIQITCQF